MPWSLRRVPSHPVPSPPAASPELAGLLADSHVRAAAAAVLDAANPAAALDTAARAGGALAPLADAVLDVVAPDEKA